VSLDAPAHPVHPVNPAQAALTVPQARKEAAEIPDHLVPPDSVVPTAPLACLAPPVPTVSRENQDHPEIPATMANPAPRERTVSPASPDHPALLAATVNVDHPELWDHQDPLVSAAREVSPVCEDLPELTDPQDPKVHLVKAVTPVPPVRRDQPETMADVVMPVLPVCVALPVAQEVTDAPEAVDDLVALERTAKVVRWDHPETTVCQDLKDPPENAALKALTEKMVFPDHPVASDPLEIWESQVPADLLDQLVKLERAANVVLPEVVVSPDLAVFPEPQETPDKLANLEIADQQEAPDPVVFPEAVVIVEPLENPERMAVVDHPDHVAHLDLVERMVVVAHLVLLDLVVNLETKV